MWLVRCQPCATFPGDPSCEPLLGHSGRALANQSAAQPTRSCTSPEDLRVLQRWIQKMHAAVESMFDSLSPSFTEFDAVSFKLPLRFVNTKLWHYHYDISFPNNLQLPCICGLWPSPRRSIHWQMAMWVHSHHKIGCILLHLRSCEMETGELWKSGKTSERGKKWFHNLTSIPTSTMRSPYESCLVLAVSRPWA